MEAESLGACRTYASWLDFCSFSLLRRCQEHWFCQGKTVAQLRSAFVALQQEKIIKNRLEGLKPDRLLEPAFSSREFSSIFRNTTLFPRGEAFPPDTGDGRTPREMSAW